MALGDLMPSSPFSQTSSSVVTISNHLEECEYVDLGGALVIRDNSRDSSDAASSSYGNASTATSMAYLPHTVVLCELRHEAFEECGFSGRSDCGAVSRWRRKDRLRVLATRRSLFILLFWIPCWLSASQLWHSSFDMVDLLPDKFPYYVVSYIVELQSKVDKFKTKTVCVALVLCLNISVDPPDVIKISPCARMECWIDPFSMPPQKALETIGKTLGLQYERWLPKINVLKLEQARYKIQPDPTVEDVRKLCTTWRKNAKSERVLFHYNGHGVPKPTANGEIWLFNKSYTQYIPLPISDLDSWLRTPSIYVFDCSAGGMVVNAFMELPDWTASSSSGSSMRDCILLAACEAHETLPQSAEFPADVFTSCLTTPIKMALRWFWTRSLLRESLDYSLIDKIPGRQNDRKTLLGELNWIFTAVTDTIAWNVLPHDLFQRLFRQDLLVASLFRNFLLAERIMRSANCSPISYPVLPPTHQHHMWDAWDMAAEICLSQLPTLLEDPNADFQPSPFFTEQLTAFEVWLDHGSERKKPPEQLPIVLQVLLSQSHRFRALVLLGRFLDMGPWAVDLSCQVDLVKDGGHIYFIRFLDSVEAYPEQRAMAAFVLAVIADGHRRGQEVCIEADLIHVCLQHLHSSFANDAQTEPLFLQWLCLCLGKLWEDFTEAQVIGLQADASVIYASLLSEPQPEVRASAVFALGTLLDVGFDSSRNGGDEECDDDEKIRAETNILKSLLNAVSDGSPLVRAEVAIALARFAFGHNKHLKPIAAAYCKPQSNAVLSSLPSLAMKGAGSVYTPPPQSMPHGILGPSQIGPLLRVGGDGQSAVRDGRVSTSSPLTTSGIMHGSPLSDDSSQHSDSGLFSEDVSYAVASHTRPRPLDNALYSRCIVAMLTLAKDPSPRIAILGRRVLSVIGIEQVVTKSMKSTSSGARPGELTTPPLTGLARSASWFDMNGAADDSEEMLARREEREKIALDNIAKCQRTSINKLHDQITSRDTKFETSTKTILLQPFNPVVIAADETERIRIWNYEEDKLLNSFDNHDYADKGISKLSLVNELDDSLLLVASCDGNVRIWKDYVLKDKQKLVTAFSAVQGHRPGVRSVNAVVDWQQQSGYLYASGEVSSIMVWDLDKEQLLNSVPSSSDCSISALSASQVHPGQFAAGFVDGSVRLFDIRAPELPVCTTPPHTQRVEIRVVGIGFQPGLDQTKIVSASQAGDIQFLDIRRLRDSYLSINAHKGSLTALAVHRHAPIIASGSAKQIIKVFNMKGQPLGSMRYKMGSLNCLTFHPYQILLAAGAADALLMKHLLQDE
ncbi:hypothetical protein RHMOL_Rhmol05G0316600 [Rhododendron molle]|uniref:Uncharacterized protein n=1 Tax=Rhododendron molle TaxID=49168 RepID=A0ACC0NVE2_RHOML|nr:hypothetical protein RHMOL_Rhmol05G0316600 [Rhododendron molle]